MSFKKSIFQNAFVSFLLALSLLSGAVGPSIPTAEGALQDDGLRIDFHDQTGKASFIGTNPGSPFSLRGGAGVGLGAQADSLAYVEHFRDLLGLTAPAQELTLMAVRTSSDPDRTSVRYQQVYKGVPVLAGEIIVNLTEAGNLLSVSAEVSPDLSLSTEPKLSAEEAAGRGLEDIAKAYGRPRSDFEVRTPALWIYDERLLRPSSRPAELVWRMEVVGLGVRELVLVNAQRGGMSLHFNQIDTSWAPSAPMRGQRAASGSNLFEPYVTYPAGEWAYAVGIGDFNADGRGDVAISSGSNLYVFLQNGSGELGNPSVYDAGGRPESLTVGDLNGDGRDDVAVGNFASNSVGVYLQSESGGLEPMVSYATSMGPDGVKIGDVNGDGRDDLVVSHWNAPGIGVFLQKADGTLEAMVSVPAPQAGYDEIDAGDVNGDGRLDVVKMSGQGSGPNLSVYLQNADGSLAEAVPYRVGSLTKGEAIGDVTGDGLNDAVVTYGGNRPNARVGVLAQNGDGTLDPVVAYEAYDIPEAVEVADVNEDGRADVVVAHGGWSRISVFAQASNGALESYQLYHVPYASHYKPQGLAVGDISGDGLPDVVLADYNHGMVVLRHISVAPTPTPTTTPSATPPVPTGKRQTYTAENTFSLPGTFLCDETDPVCTNGADPHADAAHRYAGDTYAFYFTNHGRDSLDNEGMTLISTVHVGEAYENAFWDGYQVAYGDGFGFPLADDVVGHELTHGVTEHTSALFYYYQSGAINESLSDVWGEFIDLTNGSGTDTPNVRWRVGEDVTGLGAIRDMANPPAFGDPDKMTSPNYWTDPQDNGGVHANSGVNNKAVALMTDGGSFNGRTVDGIGIPKVAAIYYEAQTNLLTSGSDYGDLYNALFQACLNLLDGAAGIVPSDCKQVRQATEAVEMHLEPEPGFSPDADVCPSGKAPVTIFYDDFESEAPLWTTDAIVGDTGWGLIEGYAHSGKTTLYGDDIFESSDNYAMLDKDFALPEDAYLRFDQAFWFEEPNYDGGWLEYSLDSGANWSDAGSLIDSGLAYTGKISRGWDNPNKGHPAFVAESHGYVSTRLGLGSLAGSDVRFRWRMSTDSVGYGLGWLIDDVTIYTCEAAPPQTFEDVSRDHWAFPYIEALYPDYVAGCSDDPRLYCPERGMQRDEAAVFVERGVHGAGFVPEDPPDDTPIFADVPVKDYWGTRWVHALWNEGFTAGCGVDEGSSLPLFCPLSKHIRAEATVFLLRILKGPDYLPPELDPKNPPDYVYEDVPVSNDIWYAKWVYAAFAEGLIDGCEDDENRGDQMFRPGDDLTRAEAACMMVRAIPGLSAP